MCFNHLPFNKICCPLSFCKHDSLQVHILFLHLIAYSTGSFMMSKSKLRPLAEMEKVSHQTRTSRTKNMCNFKENTIKSQSNTKYVYENESRKNHFRQTRIEKTPPFCQWERICISSRSRCYIFNTQHENTIF